MRRIVKLTLAILLLLVGLGTALITVALYVLNDEDYLDIATLSLQKALGWSLEVRGPVSVDRSLTFVLTGQDAVLRRGKTRLAAAKQATFRLKLSSLLHGQFRFEVDVNNPDIRFAFDKAGKTSWNFEQISEPGGGFPLETVIDGIRLGKGQASIRDESSGTALKLNLKEIQFKEGADHYEARFNFDSTYDGHDFRAKGKSRINLQFDTLYPDFVFELLKGRNKPVSSATVPNSKAKRRKGSAQIVALQMNVSGKLEDPFSSLRTHLNLSAKMDDLSALKEYFDEFPAILAKVGPVTAMGRFTGSKGKYKLQDIDARLERKKLQVHFTGSLTQLPDAPFAQLKTEVHDSDLATLSTLLNTELPAVGPLDLSADLELRRNHYRAVNLKVKLGQSDLLGSVSLHMSEAKPRVIAELSSQRLKLDEVFSIEGPKKTKTDQTQQLFTDEPIPVDWLRAFNALIQADVQIVNVLNYEFKDLHANLEIADGILNLSYPVKWAEGSSHSKIRIDTSGSLTRFHYRDDYKKIPAESALALPKGIITGGKLDGHIQLEAQGDTPKALATSLNGDVLLEMGEARLVESGLKDISADLLSGILRSLNPRSDKKGRLSTEGYTDYRCGVMGIEIKDGILRSNRGIALESEKFNIGGDGFVDMKEQTIALVIRPRAKTGLGLSIGTLLGGFSVGGTLSSPEVQISGVGVAVTATVGPIAHLLRDWVTVNEFSCANTLKRIKEPKVADKIQEQAENLDQDPIPWSSETEQ